MSIQKKSLISTLKTAKKANVATGSDSGKNVVSARVTINTKGSHISTKGHTASFKVITPKKMLKSVV